MKKNVVDGGDITHVREMACKLEINLGSDFDFAKPEWVLLLK